MPNLSITFIQCIFIICHGEYNHIVDPRLHARQPMLTLWGSEVRPRVSKNELIYTQRFLFSCADFITFLLSRRDLSWCSQRACPVLTNGGAVLHSQMAIFNHVMVIVSWHGIISMTYGLRSILEFIC